MLSINDLAQGYLMLLSEQAQLNAASNRILLPKFSTAEPTVHQAQPDLLFLFLALGARARARGGEGLAGRYGVNPQGRCFIVDAGCRRVQAVTRKLKPPRLSLATRSLDVPDIFEAVRQHRLQLLEEIRMYGVLIVGFSFM